MGTQNTQVGYADAKTIAVPWSGVSDRTPVAIPQQEICYTAAGNVGAVSMLCAYGVTELADAGVKLTNQQNLASAFLGLAASRKVATDISGTVDIDRSAVKFVSCAALQTAANVGDMVAGSPGNAGGTALVSNFVEVTTNASAAIGYVIQQAPLGATQLLVMFTSRMAPSTIPNVNQAINTAANLSLTGNMAVGGTLTATGASALAAVTATTGKFTGLVTQKSGTLAATGTAIGNAAAIVAQATSVTGANNAAGVQLPTFAANCFSPLWVKNADATNSLKVYPAVNCGIDAGGANAAATLAALESRAFFSDGSATYFSMKGA